MPLSSNWLTFIRVCHPDLFQQYLSEVSNLVNEYVAQHKTAAPDHNEIDSKYFKMSQGLAMSIRMEAPRLV